MIPPKFHFILRRNHFIPRWIFLISQVGICDFLRTSLCIETSDLLRHCSYDFFSRLLDVRLLRIVLDTGMRGLAAEMCGGMYGPKKVGRKFGGLGKMYYLCTRNSKERVFGGVWRPLSGEQVLTARALFGGFFVEVPDPNG